MSEAIRLQLQHLLNADDVEYAALHQPSAVAVGGAGSGAGAGAGDTPAGLLPSRATHEHKNIHIEQLALLTKSAIEEGTTEDLNDVLHELAQSKDLEIKLLCENHDSPLMSVAQQLRQVNAKARGMKTTIDIVGQQIERSSQQLIEKVGRHVHMKRTRMNIEESLKIVKLCLVALEHTNQVQELLKANHRVAAVQNLQDLQGMELNELRNIGMGALIQQSVGALTNEISAATLNSLTSFFDSRNLKQHVEDVGVRADKLTQLQRHAWDVHLSQHRHLRAYRFNSPVELAYRRSNDNFLTNSQLKVDLGPLCEAEMVFKKLGKLDELRSFLETKFSRFGDDYLAVSDLDKLLLSVNRIVGFCLFDRICSNLLPMSRPAKLVDDSWEKLAQNISSVIGSALNGRRIQDFAVIESKLGMVMSTLQNFDFNVAIINDLFRSLLTKISDQIVQRARKEFNDHWISHSEQTQYVCDTRESYEDVLRVVWYDPSKYEDHSSGNNEFPKVLPFSEIYVVTCRHLRSLLEHGTAFLEYFQQEPGFVENTISSAVDSLLTDPVCSTLETVAQGRNRELMVQTSVNLQLFEYACKNIEQSLAKLRGATGRRGSVALEAKEKIAKAAKGMETRIHVLVEASIREIMSNGFDWHATEEAFAPSATVLEMTTYMLTMANTLLKRLPPQTRELTYFTLTENIGVAMCSSLYDIPMDFTTTGLDNFDVDLKFLETSMSEIATQSAPPDTLVEAHQTIELLRSTDPVKELNDPTIRNRKYGRVSPMHMSQLMQKLSKRKQEFAPQSPDVSASGYTSPRTQQSGFMRYLSGDK